MPFSDLFSRHLGRVAGVTPMVFAGLLLAACSPQADTAGGVDDTGEEDVITDFALAPPGARPGACYGKDVTPAVIRREHARKLVAPPVIGPAGNVISPAQYEDSVSDTVVEGRKTVYFETPCPPRWTPDFIASLQRALAVRGLYHGAVSGQLDTETRRAIRAFQLGRGLNSAILSIESARALGLVEVSLAQ